jgi:hypothetical protein
MCVVLHWDSTRHGPHAVVFVDAGRHVPRQEGWISWHNLYSQYYSPIWHTIKLSLLVVCDVCVLGAVKYCTALFLTHVPSSTAADAPVFRLVPRSRAGMRGRVERERSRLSDC